MIKKEQRIRIACWLAQKKVLQVLTSRLLLARELTYRNTSVYLRPYSLNFSTQFFPLSLMALIPAAAAAGGPVCASLSLCIFPVIKQMVTQDSVHAQYWEGWLVNTPLLLFFLLRWPPRHTTVQLTCAVKTACSGGTASWKYWQGCRNEPQLVSRKICQITKNTTQFKEKKNLRNTNKPFVSTVVPELLSQKMEAQYYDKVCANSTIV